MLLFSTILDIDESLTRDKFIELVIEWNQKSPHEENVIPNLSWSGERNVRFGTDSLWLDIEEYGNGDIIAVRYEKVEPDGIIWDSDYVVNFKEMRLAIQLDRSYREDALAVRADFSTPHFITMLIANGYLKKDGGLAIQRVPLLLTENDISLLADVIEGKSRYRLPVVYVSKTMAGKDPVNVSWLASRLKGAAHVLVEESRDLDDKIRFACADKNEYDGGIGIYYPNPAVPPRRFFRPEAEEDAALLNQVVRTVILYGNSQNISPAYTWNGVWNMLLHDKLESKREELLAAETAKQRAEAEVNEVYNAFDEELGTLETCREEVERLRWENERLREENRALLLRFNGTEGEPILTRGMERDLFPGEIKDFLLSALEQAIQNSQGDKKARRRRVDVLRDIFDNNEYERQCEEKGRRVKNLLKSYDGMSRPVRHKLEELGFGITGDGKHYKLVYCEDNRYCIVLSKTPSDVRGGRNEAADIVKLVF